MTDTGTAATPTELDLCAACQHTKSEHDDSRVGGYCAACHSVCLEAHLADTPCVHVFESFEELLDRSSLGAPHVKAAIAACPPELLERGMKRYRELGRTKGEGVSDDR